MQKVILVTRRELESIKVYGITRIAKEVIEVADHISGAIISLEDQNQP